MPQNFQDVIRIFVDLIDTALPILAAIAVLIFIWGLVLFINRSGDAKNHADGRKFMTWGIVALFVMVSFMGIISFVYRDFGFSHPLGIPLLPQH